MFSLRNFYFFCFISFVSFGVLAKNTINSDKPNSKEDLTEIQQKIKALTKELDESQSARKDAADELKASEQAISQANKKLYDLQAQHQANQSKLNQLALEKDGTQSEITNQQKRLGVLIYEQYLHSKQNYAQSLLQQQDPNAVSRNLHYLSYVSKARTDLIDGLRGNLTKITQLNEQTSATLSQISALKQEKEEQRKTLQSQKKEKNQLLSELSSQIKSQRNEINKLKRDEQRLSNLIERLAKVIPAVKKTKPIPKSKSTNQSPIESATANKQIVANNDTLPSAEDDNNHFASLRGKLNLPVRGAVTNRFGSARAESGVSWRGLFIKSAEGNEVKSIASGRVVFADWLRGFGNVLIIDHGSGYMSIYGNNQAVLKQVGEQVIAGDTIASVGNSGGNETSGLYFELRLKSKPFDPMSWCIAR